MPGLFWQVKTNDIYSSQVYWVMRREMKCWLSRVYQVVISKIAGTKNVITYGLACSSGQWRC